MTARRRLLVSLCLLALAGLGIRVAFVLSQSGPEGSYDNQYYETEATIVGEGRGFVGVFLRDGKPQELADHPPLTVLVLVPVARLSGSDIVAMKLTFAVLGSVNVVLIGLLAARLAGSTTGVIAAALAAVYPYIWVNDGLVMSETLALLITTASVLVTFQLLERPTWARAGLLGVLCALAALTRPELLLLVPLLAFGAPLTLRTRPRATRLRLAGIGVLTALVVISPWITYNMSRFERPVYLSTNLGGTLRASSCDLVYRGPNIGLIDFFCGRKSTVRGDASVLDHADTAQAVHYIRQHLTQLPIVLLARIGRDWSLFRPLDMVNGNEVEGRPRWVMGTGLGFYYPILALAIAGIIVLRRRRVTFWPLVVPPLIVTLSVVVSWGQPRFRAVAEPILVVLAAVAISALLNRARARSRGSLTARSASTR